MSYDKLTKAVNRTQAQRVTRNQKAIFMLYNEAHWLSDRMVGGFSKGKAMNCSCRICRRWDLEGKRDRFNYQLRKAGMEKYDVRPDI